LLGICIDVPGYLSLLQNSISVLTGEIDWLILLLRTFG
jgi:hypothetical protein